MSAIKSAVCLMLATADGNETEESFHSSEIDAARALDRKCIACCWSRTMFFAGEAIIYAIDPDGVVVIGTAQVRMLGY